MPLSNNLKALYLRLKKHQSQPNSSIMARQFSFWANKVQLMRQYETYEVSD